MKNNWLISLVIFVFSLTQAKGQDPVFSQFYQAATTINPALAGMFQGKSKLSVSYRDQWYSLLESPNSYKTAYLNFDHKFKPEKKNVFTLGGMLIQDSAGEGKFRQLRGYLTSSYNMQLSEGGGGYKNLSHYLSIGMQLGLGQNSLEWGNLWFGRQYDVHNLIVDRTISSDEPPTSDQDYNSSVYPDLNIGLAWTGIASNKFSTHAGISMSHINTPSISNYGSIFDKLFRRVSLNAGAGFRAGAYMRVANSIDGINLEGLVVSAMFEKRNIQIGASYDFTLSKLRLPSNSLGGFEISISYINPDGANYDNPRVPGF